MFGFTAETLIELEVRVKIDVAYGEKKNFRLGLRNGYRDCDWDTQAGTVKLGILKLPEGSDFSRLLEPQAMAEKTLR